MRNPWFDLPEKAPFLLPIDRPYVEAHNKLLKQTSNETSARRFNKGIIVDDEQLSTYDRVRIHAEAIPEPFSGIRSAPIVILLANPKLEVDPKKRPNAAQAALIKKGLTSPIGLPFFAISDEFKGTGAHNWWWPKLEQLCGDVGFDTVANNIQVIELHGYHSLKYMSPMRNFPSQEFQFYLVRQAIERGALIVVPWTVKHWQASVPELMDKQLLRETGAEVVTGRPPYRQAGITKTLLQPGGYLKVVRRLRSINI